MLTYFFKAGKTGLAMLTNFCSRICSRRSSTRVRFNDIFVFMSMLPDLMVHMNASNASISSASIASLSETKYKHTFYQFVVSVS